MGTTRSDAAPVSAGAARAGPERRAGDVSALQGAQDNVLALQRSAGNAAVAHLLTGGSPAPTSRSSPQLLRAVANGAQPGVQREEENGSASGGVGIRTLAGLALDPKAFGVGAAGVGVTHGVDLAGEAYVRQKGDEILSQLDAGLAGLHEKVLAQPGVKAALESAARKATIGREVAGIAKAVAPYLAAAVVASGRRLLEQGVAALRGYAEQLAPEQVQVVKEYVARLDEKIRALTGIHGMNAAATWLVDQLQQYTGQVLAGELRAQVAAAAQDVFKRLAASEMAAYSDMAAKTVTDFFAGYETGLRDAIAKAEGVQAAAASALGMVEQVLSYVPDLSMFTPINSKKEGAKFAEAFLGPADRTKRASHDLLAGSSGRYSDAQAKASGPLDQLKATANGSGQAGEWLTSLAGWFMTIYQYSALTSEVSKQDNAADRVLVLADFQARQFLMSNSAMAMAQTSLGYAASMGGPMAMLAQGPIAKLTSLGISQATAQMLVAAGFGTVSAGAVGFIASALAGAVMLAAGKRLIRFAVPEAERQRMYDTANYYAAEADKFLGGAPSRGLASAGAGAGAFAGAVNSTVSSVTGSVAGGFGSAASTAGWAMSTAGGWAWSAGEALSASLTIPEEPRHDAEETSASPAADGGIDPAALAEVRAAIDAAIAQLLAGGAPRPPAPVITAAPPRRDEL
jgi:hypothetical protein